MQEPITTLEELKDAIECYGANKSELDSYKKLCDAGNAEIKKYMQANGIDKSVSENYTVTRSIRESVSFDEPMLLTAFKKLGITDFIKTREYVDMEALESAIYKGELPAELIQQVKDCQITKQTIALTIKPRKKEK